MKFSPDPNLSAFDRTAQTLGAPAEAAADSLDNLLNAAQRRHQERLAKLQAEYLDEQQQIRQLTQGTK